MKTASRPVRSLAVLSLTAALAAPAAASARGLSPLMRVPDRPALHASGTVRAASGESSALLFDGRGEEGAPVRMECVAFSPDGKWVAAGGNDGNVRLFDARSGKPGDVIDAGASTEALAFAPDGRRLAGVTGDTVAVWSVPSGRVAWTRTGGRGDLEKVHFEECAAFTPDGSTLAVGASRDAASGGVQGMVALLDARTGSLRKLLGAYGEPVNAVAVSPDGKRVAGVTGRFEAEHPEAFVWDVASGEEVWDSRAESGPLLAVAFSPDGHTLVTGGRSPGDSALHVWEAKTGALERTMGHSETVLAVAFAPDGRTLLTGGLDGALKVWDWPAARLRKSWPGAEAPLSIFGVAFAPDGRRFAAASDEGTVRLWDVP